MRTDKFLTDIRIAQSETWQRNTDYIGGIHIPLTRSLESLFRSASAAPFLKTLKILLLRKRYAVVINADLRTAQLLAFIRNIFKLSFPRQIVLELMLDEARDDVFWGIKRTIQSFIFKKVDLIFVSSRSETAAYSERLRLPNGRIRFLPFHTNVVEPRTVQGTGGYFLSAGKTGRDFEVLAQAIKNLNCEVVVVSDENSVKGVELPQNVKLFLNISYPKYLEMLADCHAVIVPLKRLVKSTGQVVILEAMALGKPVIATETVGTIDYIQSGINGILVPPDDSNALAKAISQLMADRNLCKRLSVNALKSVKDLHTFEIYVNTILTAAGDLAPSVYRSPLSDC